MGRPKLTERITLRVPLELLTDLAESADRRGVSLNEVALCCFEHEMARMGLYRLDYYAQFRRLLTDGQGDTGSHIEEQARIGGQIANLSDKRKLV